MNLLSPNQLTQALPVQMRKNVNQELVDNINKVLADPDMYEAYRDNLLNYTSVLQEGKYRIKDYVNAVKYVSNRLMGYSNADSYMRTFPEKYDSWMQRRLPQKDIAAHVAMYNKTQLVNKILEKSLVPFWVLNQDMFQQALNTQAELMLNAKSELVRMNAANSLLNHLKPPTTQKIELDIGVTESSAVQALREQTLELVAAQKRAIAAGMFSAKDVAEAKIIQGEARDVTA